jgi:hypothetical protein
MFGTLNYVGKSKKIPGAQFNVVANAPSLKAHAVNGFTLE